MLTSSGTLQAGFVVVVAIPHIQIFWGKLQWIIPHQHFPLRGDNKNYSISTVLNRVRQDHSKYTPTPMYSCRHRHILQVYYSTQSATQTQDKQITKRGLNYGGKTAVWEGKHAGSLVLGKKKCFKVGLERVQRGFLLEGKEKVIPCRGAEYGKGMRTNSRKSDIWGIWKLRVSEAEQKVVRVCNLKIVTEIRRSSAHDTLKVRDFILYWILSEIESQCSYWNRGVMWSD